MTGIATTFLISKYLWFCGLIALGMMLAASKLSTLKSSTVTSLQTMVLVNGIMAVYQPYLHAAYTDDNGPVVNLFWYVGFSILNAWAIRMIYNRHKSYNINYSFITKMLIGAYSILCFLQLATYFEMLNYKSDFMGPYYDSLIPAIDIVSNIGLLAVGTYSLTTFLLFKFIPNPVNNRLIKGLIWTL